ncbi:MAG: hypothetical protein AAF721_28035 [Myxococcota bacterium]
MAQRSARQRPNAVASRAAIEAPTPSRWFNGAPVLIGFDDIHRVDREGDFEDEDRAHFRFAMFDDGHVLYRRLRDGQWQWWTAHLDAAEHDALLRSVRQDLRDTPLRFACARSSSPVYSAIAVPVDGSWRVHVGANVASCGDGPFDEAPSLYAASQAMLVDHEPPGFLAARRRLYEFDAEDRRPWVTPRLTAAIYPDVPFDPVPPPWPAWLPFSPEKSARDGVVVQLDGSWGPRLRTAIPGGKSFRHDGRNWLVVTRREQPGDGVAALALHTGFQEHVAAQRARCRQAADHVQTCLLEHPELASRSDELCRQLTAWMADGVDCHDRARRDDVCRNAYAAGCRPPLDFMRPLPK